ncbi:hypothetical protein EW146_g5209 [Bondarzewia mesenterica]|uniref:Fungal lipase-type domain-containing protein n=1 Tax=Bondarzewia mesenterica TaxID=1095465 RepID=A0A4S4LS60_9AGAM|nr:hypothetical protein EW146_g5209 [Bondarzewia mesenterica]
MQLQRIGSIIAIHFLVSVCAVHASLVQRDISQVCTNTSTDLYDDLVFYFKYASSAYSVSCPSPNGNTLVKQFSELTTDTQGFIARDDTRKEIVVAFRGSSSIVDFANDEDHTHTVFTVTGTTPPANTTVLTGYLKAWNSVVNETISTVQTQLSLYPDYTLVTSGHSLGGGLSSLAAITLKQNIPNSTVRMYTYGQPRTGNDIYAFFINDNFGSNAFRVVHTMDGVPKVVPTSLGFRHHGIEYWQSSEPPSAEMTRQCAPDGEDPTCSASAPGANAAVLAVLWNTMDYPVLFWELRISVL